MPGQNHEVYQFGRFLLSPSRHALYVGESEIPLAPKSFEVLLYLARNPGRLVTKEELLTAVWPDAMVEEGNLAQQISRLRKAFETEPGTANLIRTVPGRGYQFTAEVSRGENLPLAVANEASPIFSSESVSSAGAGYSVERWRERTHTIVEEMLVPASAVPIPASPAVARRRVAVAVAVLAIVGLGSWAAWRWHSRAAPSEPRQIVLADVINNTGDATFDRTLKRALEIDLTQSPYMDVLSERSGVDTLQMMGRRADTALTPDIAREICERTNRKVLLTGTISSLGRRYLLTLEASDCSSAKPLASAKAEAGSKEGVLEALDRVAEGIRRGLNESAQSLASYEVPLRSATTSSLDALKAYSVGVYLDSQGRPKPEIIAAFQRAVELDPQFAMAYRWLGVENSYVDQPELAAQYVQKAFELSEHVSALEQLSIRATYYVASQGDLIKGIEAYRLWASTYPQDPVPVADEIDCYMTLGQWDRAVATGERGARLFPSYALMYENMATIYRSVGRYEDAKNATRLAAQVGKGETGEHLSNFENALAQQDEATLAREDQWYGAHEDGATVWYYPAFRGDAAAGAGNLKRAEELYRIAYDSARRANLPESADVVLIHQALAEFNLGLRGAARATLGRVRRVSGDNPDVVGLYAELGEPAFAERFLAAHSAPSPDTLMTYVFVPRVRAALALERGKPLDAIAALESSRPYEMRDYAVPTLRGQAYLKAGQPDLAIGEYKKILSHPGIDPLSVLYSMAYVEVARASADIESRREYEAFFTRWKDADPDLPLLKQARAEYAQRKAVSN
jgi:DNA-binding winged helix-turn-helix (wHTH) protein